MGTERKAEGPLPDEVRLQRELSATLECADDPNSFGFEGREFLEDAARCVRNGSVIITISATH